MHPLFYASSSEMTLRFAFLVRRCAYSLLLSSPVYYLQLSSRCIITSPCRISSLNNHTPLTQHFLFPYQIDARQTRPFAAILEQHYATTELSVSPYATIPASHFSYAPTRDERGKKSPSSDLDTIRKMVLLVSGRSQKRDCHGA